jgi:cephalosporin-C deacetylase-like acetyl esterase
MFRHLRSRLDAMSLIAVLHRKKMNDEGVVRYSITFTRSQGEKMDGWKERPGE